MSDAGIALVGAGAALGGVIVSQVVNLIVEQRREIANYRVNLYAKRLEAHQQAFEWMHRLNFELNRAQMEDLAAATSNARDWWNANALYLDPQSKSELVYFLNLCFGYAQGNLGPEENIWRQMNQTEKAIVRGIGMKHLEKGANETHDGR